MKTRHIVIALGLTGLLATTHCSGQFRAICEKERTCAGGNDADEDACVERLRASENVADAYDCGDQYSKYIDCLENAACKDRRLDGSGCVAQLRSYSECQAAASGRRDGNDDNGGGSQSSGSGSGGGSGSGSSGAAQDGGK